KLIGYGTRRTLFQDHVDDLRNDIARPLHNDSVADADVASFADRLPALAKPLDVILIVERRIGHHHAAHGDRLQPRNGRQRTGAAHLDIDAAQDRDGLLGGKLVRDGPARAARAETQPVLKVEPIDLVDHAVDVVIKVWQ